MTHSETELIWKSISAQERNTRARSLSIHVILVSCPHFSTDTKKSHLRSSDNPGLTQILCFHLLMDISKQRDGRNLPSFNYSRKDHPQVTVGSSICSSPIEFWTLSAGVLRKWGHGERPGCISRIIRIKYKTVNGTGRLKCESIISMTVYNKRKTAYFGRERDFLSERSLNDLFLAML